MGILGMHPYADMEDSELDHECQKMLINMMLMERKRWNSVTGAMQHLHSVHMFSVYREMYYIFSEGSG